MNETTESRCLHDMIEWPGLGLSSCSWCKNIPDVHLEMPADEEYLPIDLVA